MLGVEVEHETVGVEVDMVGRPRQGRRDLLGRFEASQLNEAWVALQSLSDKAGRLSLTLRPNNIRSLVLNSTVNNELGALGLLLS